jgi:uncharacterized protein (DUF433 family)
MPVNASGHWIWKHDPDQAHDRTALGDEVDPVAWAPEHLFGEPTMAKTRPPYTPEGLVRAGRSPEELAHEFEPTAQSIRNWVGQANATSAVSASG